MQRLFLLDEKSAYNRFYSSFRHKNMIRYNRIFKIGRYISIEKSLVEKGGFYNEAFSTTG